MNLLYGVGRRGMTAEGSEQQRRAVTHIRSGQGEQYFKTACPNQSSSPPAIRTFSTLSRTRWNRNRPDSRLYQVKLRQQRKQAALRPVYALNFETRFCNDIWFENATLNSPVRSSI